MIKKTYQLRLASPAFLGDASQKGVWRTPPLKALLREWWRVAVAHDLNNDVAALKAHEKALFGTAADDNPGGNQQSRVRLALKHWNEGTCTSWPSGEVRVTHPEVKNRDGKPMQVGSELYLGYGPLTFQQGTNLKNGAALQADETNELRLAFPDREQPALEAAITLAHWFGTIGGRSRNGWGSLLFHDTDNTSAIAPLSRTELEKTGCVRKLRDCLDLDWPHAIGSDHKGVLVWKSKTPFADWRKAMAFLAMTKIAFRTALQFTTGDRATRIEQRHVLAYPVTKHSINAWGKNTRIANTLRFKLFKNADDTLGALIYHTPCRPVVAYGNVNLLATWQTVHGLLDANANLTRLT